jgi:copper(I)-binding protein
MFLKNTLIATTLVLASAAALAQAVKVETPWARPTAQGQAAGGGFLRIVGGAANDKLVSASSEVAGRVELHTMKMEGDIMRMRQIDAIEVPAGKTVDLAPGGLHVMFMDLKAPLKTGSSFPLTLKFEKAGEVKVDVKVQTAPPGGMPAMKGEAKAEPKHDHKH